MPKKERKYLTDDHVWLMYDLARSSGWRVDTRTKRERYRFFNLKQRGFVKKVEYMNGTFWEPTKRGLRWLDKNKSVIKL